MLSLGRPIVKISGTVSLFFSLIILKFHIYNWKLYSSFLFENYEYFLNWKKHNDFLKVHLENCNPGSTESDVRSTTCSIQSFNVSFQAGENESEHIVSFMSRVHSTSQRARFKSRNVLAGLKIEYRDTFLGKLAPPATLLPLDFTSDVFLDWTGQ